MVKSIWGIFVLGLTSSFFLMSSGLPAKVTKPEVLYFTTFGFVEIAKLKARVTSLLPFFCSSSFALTSKKSSSLDRYSPVRSACRLLRLIETITPETEYCGFTVDSSFYIILVILIFNFCIYIHFLFCIYQQLLLGNV